MTDDTQHPWEMSHADYLAYPALSASGIKAFLDGPKQYLAKTYGPPSGPSREMELGTLVHTAVLEPEDLMFCVWDGGRRSGKEWDRFAAAAADSDKDVLTLQEYHRVVGMRDAVRSHRVAQEYLSQPGHVEQPVFTAWDIDGMATPIKIKPDKLAAECVVDIKTTRDPSPDAFSMQIAKLRYWLQAWLYMEVTGRDRFVFVAVRSTAPYEVGVYDIHRGDPAFLLGEEVRERDLPRLVQCYRTGVWSDIWERQTTAVEIPKWYLDQHIWGGM